MINPFERLFFSVNNRFAVRMLANPTEADDIVQDVFMKIWNYREKYVPINHFRAWALRICSNLCLDRKRSFENRNLELKSAKELQMGQENSPEDLPVNFSVSMITIFYLCW